MKKSIGKLALLAGLSTGCAASLPDVAPLGDRIHLAESCTDEVPAGVEFDESDIEMAAFLLRKELISAINRGDTSLVRATAQVFCPNDRSGDVFVKEHKKAGESDEVYVINHLGQEVSLPKVMALHLSGILPKIEPKNDGNSLVVSLKELFPDK